jgi:putative ABC transport system ATP-binding protein
MRAPTRCASSTRCWRGARLAEPVLAIAGLTKRYGTSTVFADVDLVIAPGEFVAVMGESGVGKSTLLNCAAGLDSIDAGSVHVVGTDIHALAEPAQAVFRRHQLGFVFQAFHVLPHLSVGANVALPLLLQHAPDPARVSAMLGAVGLAGFEARLPQTLSGGQLQRVAIARALVHRPKLILADEPTGNLDPASADRVLVLLAEQVRAHGAACLLATHSRAAAARADRAVALTPSGIVA